MKRLIIAAWLGAAVMPALMQPAFAQSDASFIDKAINAPSADQWNVLGSAQSHALIKDAAVPGGYALNIDVQKAGEHPWDVQAGLNAGKAVKKGDVLLFAFWARNLTQAQGEAMQIVGRIQQNHAPYSPVGEQALDLSSDWKLYYVAGTAFEDMPEGQLSAGVHLAQRAQSVALGPVYVLDFGPGYDIAKLPKN